VLITDELQWLLRHRHEVVADLLRASGLDLPDARPLGTAGSALPAWHCHIAIGTPHERAVRRDGTEYCGTCHPRTIASRPRR
jgi:hypothetical protein